MAKVLSPDDQYAGLLGEVFPKPKAPTRPFTPSGGTPRDTIHQIFAPRSGHDVDIVLIHGLNGGARSSWTSTFGFWPKDRLPSLVPNARVLSYQWRSDLATLALSSTLEEIIEELLAALLRVRRTESASRVPLIFVCHSLSSILIKGVLLRAYDLRWHTSAKQTDIEGFLLSVYGVLYLASPQIDVRDNVAWSLTLRKIFVEAFPSSALESFAPDFSALHNIEREFGQQNRFPRLKAFYFFEKLPSDLPSGPQIIIPAKYAAPLGHSELAAGIDANHTGICKLTHKNARSFSTFLEVLEDWATEAPGTVQRLWDHRQMVDLQQTLVKRFLDIESMNESLVNPRPPDPSSSASSTAFDLLDSQFDNNYPDPAGAPLRVCPENVLPNQCVFGLHDEREMLEQMLPSSRRNRGETQAVLLWSIAPGMGKTHLAKEYFFGPRRGLGDYTGGSFWLDASSRNSLMDSFWTIAHRIGVHEGAGANRFCQSGDTTLTFQEVQTWFRNRKDWLMVFDDVHFSHDLSPRDLANLIPQGIRCSTLFTSSEETFIQGSKDFRLPSIEIRPLTADDGRSLLEWAIDDGNPLPEDYYVLVTDRFQCNPRAICIFGRQIKVLKRSLNYTQPESLGRGKVHLGADILELLQIGSDAEVRRLLNLLAFFKHRIPYAFVLFAAKRLKIGTIGLEKCLDTLTELGVVRSRIPERSPTESFEGIRSPSSRRRKGHGDLFIDTDAQQIIRQLLMDSGDHETWLALAADTFSKAFEAAVNEEATSGGTLTTRDLRKFRAQGQYLTSYCEYFRQGRNHRPAFEAQIELDLSMSRIERALSNRKVVEVSPPLKITFDAENLSEVRAGVLAEDSSPDKDQEPRVSDEALSEGILNHRDTRAVSEWLPIVAGVEPTIQLSEDTALHRAIETEARLVRVNENLGASQTSNYLQMQNALILLMSRVALTTIITFSVLYEAPRYGRYSRAGSSGIDDNSAATVALNEASSVLWHFIIGELAQDTSAILHSSISILMLDIERAASFVSRSKSATPGPWTRLRVVLGQRLVNNRLLWAEAPLRPGMRRIRWKCICGQNLYDDYLEAIPGSLDNLEAALNERPQRGTPSSSGSMAYLRAAWANGIGLISGSNRSSTQTDSQASPIPLYNTPTRPPNSTSQPSNVMYLLMCVKQNVLGTKLHHQQIKTHEIKNDRDFFNLLRKGYSERRKYLSLPFTIKTVTCVSLVKFLVDLSDFVDKQRHDLSCGNRPSECTCIPPKDKVVPAANAEYYCEPIPPGQAPPLGTAYLTHNFHNPQCVREGQISTFNQVPKRGSGRLATLSGDVRAVGWGIDFEEGWEFGMVVFWCSLWEV